MDEGKFESLKQVQPSDVPAVLPIVRGYVLENRNTLSKLALEAICAVPNIERYVGEDIQQRVSSGRFDFKIFDDFELLAAIKTPEAVRQIGMFVQSDAVLESPSLDMASDSLRSISARSLSRIGFFNAPTPDFSRAGMTEEEVNDWQTWWAENQANIDELVKEANKRPPPTSSKRHTAIPQSPPTIAASPRPSVRATPAAATGKLSSSFPIILVVILATLIAIVAVLVLRRKAP